MKRIIQISFCLISVLSLHAQTILNYQEETVLFSNPERGFYHHTETHSASYSALNSTTLKNYRTNENITLILRVFYLEDFKTSAISTTYLDKIKQDFVAIRTAGIKCIVRFAYNDDQTKTDASKAIVLQHLDQLKPILEDNADVIAFMQAGFIGSWGEWYYTTQSEFGLPASSPNYTNRGEVLAKIHSSLPVSRMVQLRTPAFKQNIFSSTSAMLSSQAFKGTPISRTGHHNDCFLASSTDFGTYSNVTKDKAYLAKECLYVVNGGETCAQSDYSGCPTALSDLATLHYSYLNTDYNKTVLNTWTNDGCMDDVKKNLGYRFRLISSEAPSFKQVGDSLAIKINLVNEGWASLYNSKNVSLVIRSKSNTTKLYTFDLAIDPRFWLPNQEQTIYAKVLLPKDMTIGEYDVLLNLSDPALNLKNKPEYSIRFANKNTWEALTGYNKLTTLSVTNITSIDDAFAEDAAFIFPMPVRDYLNIQNHKNHDYKIYNQMGLMILEGEIKEETFSLDFHLFKEGVYFVELSNDTSSKRYKIVK